MLHVKRKGNKSNDINQKNHRINCIFSYFFLSPVRGNFLCMEKIDINEKSNTENNNLKKDISCT